MAAAARVRAGEALGGGEVVLRQDVDAAGGVGDIAAPNAGLGRHPRQDEAEKLARQAFDSARPALEEWREREQKEGRARSRWLALGAALQGVALVLVLVGALGERETLMQAALAVLVAGVVLMCVAYYVFVSRESQTTLRAVEDTLAPFHADLVQRAPGYSLHASRLWAGRLYRTSTVRLELRFATAAAAAC